MTIAQMLDNGHIPFDYNDYKRFTKSPASVEIYFSVVGTLVGAKKLSPNLSYEDAYIAFTTPINNNITVFNNPVVQTTCSACGGGKVL